MSNVRRFPLAPDPAAEEAAAWVARRDTGPLAADVQASFDAWLAAAPGNHAAFEDHDGLWRELDALRGSDADTEVAAAPEPIALERPRYMTRAAAAVVALGLATSVLVTAYTLRGGDSYTTETGETRSVTLADGSRVTLNTATELEVDFDRDARTIKLAHGEAFFEVAHDPARPFTVETATGAVRAVGTKFVVRVEQERRLNVLVTEGKVKVSRETSTAAPTYVGAGQELTAMGRRIDVAAVPQGQAERELAWRQGDIVFTGEPLGRAIAEMQRYTDRRVTVDPSIAGLAVGGYFRTNDFDGFLAAVQLGFPVDVIEEDGGVRFVPRAQAKKI